MDRPPVGADEDGVARRGPDRQAALIAAYREGLGLTTALMLICSSAGIRLAASAAEDDEALAGEVKARWWCRRAADATHVAAAATARLKLDDGGDETVRGRSAASPTPRDMATALLRAGQSIERAARKLDVALRSDEDVAAEAASVIARVEEEMEVLRHAGQLKSVNRSYRTYRLEASARGEKTLRYADWMQQYKQTMVRNLAAALRHS